MATVGGLFQKHSSAASTGELCVKLTHLLEKKGGSSKGSKCTKRVYTSIIKHLDSAVANAEYEWLHTLFKALSHLAKTSTDPSSGFHNFITFGLPDKHIVFWCEALLSKSVGENWGQIVDNVLFNLTEILGHLSEDCQNVMSPLLTPLLKCICSNSLPCSAKIEAARGSNILLDTCPDVYKEYITGKSEIKQLILLMGKSIQSAGNFELQVSIVECLYRITTESIRAALAQKWFNNSSTVERFTTIRAAEFEVDCRLFLNELNVCAKERGVYSLSCMKLFCGEFELHCPQDESMGCFWVDFNTGSSSVTVNVEDPVCNTELQENEWEMITIKKSSVDNWTVKVHGGEFILLICLKDPAHTLLPSIPPSTSHDVTIHFNSVCDPSHPSKLALGAAKQVSKSSKQSRAIDYVQVIQKRVHKNQTTPLEISPIEAPPDTPVQGEQVNSQNSNITPTPKALQLATPATSTPKNSHLKQLAATSTICAHPTPSSSGRRPPLMFASSGGASAKKERSKASMALNTIVLASKKSRIIVGRTDDEQLDSEGVKEKNVISSSKNQANAELRTPTGLSKSRKRDTHLTNFRTLESPGDVDSPVFDYDPTAVVKKKLQPQVNSMPENKPQKQVAQKQTKPKQRYDKSDSKSVNSDTHIEVPIEVPSLSCSITSSQDSVLSDLSNGKQRKFNLSGVSKYHAKNSQLKGRNSKHGSRESSFHTFEPLAIPDSLPTETVKPPPKKFSTKSKAMLKRTRRSYLESDDELANDQSWEPAKKTKNVVEPESLATKPTTTRETVGKTTAKKTNEVVKPKSLATKPTATRETVGKTTAKKTNEMVKPKSLATKPTTTPATVGKTATKKGASSKIITKRKAIEKPSMTFKSQSEKQRFIDEVYGDFSVPSTKPAPTRKRIIEDVYGLTKPDCEAPKTKVIKSTTTAQKKATKQNPSLKCSSKVKPKSPLKPKRTAQRKQPELVANQKTTSKKCSKTVTKPLLSDSLSKPSLRTYGKKNYQKRLEVDHSAFDDMVASHLKKQYELPENIYSASPLKSPNETLQISIQSPIQDPPAEVDEELSISPASTVVRSPLKVSISPEQPIKSDDEESSIEESVKDKVLNTKATEKANVPKSLDQPTKDSLDLPPSPSVSVHSSQVTADLNITFGFQKMCRALISKSGTEVDLEPQMATTSFQAKNFPEDCEELEEVASVASSHSCESEHQEQDQQDRRVSLTQLTRDIVSSHQMQPPKIGSKRKQPSTSTKFPAKKALSITKKEITTRPKAKPQVVFKQDARLGSDEDMLSDNDKHDADSISQHDSVSVYSHTISPGSVSTLCQEEEDEQPPRLLEHSSNMQDLANLFDREKRTAKRAKPRKPTTSKNSQVELLQIWQHHHEERSGTLTLYRDQLFKEFEILERDVQQTRDVEKQTMHFMTKRLTTLRQNIGSQQKQVDRIRTLQVSFHQHLGKLEESQSSEQMWAHKSLKQEMHILRKKLLVDNERKEISRIKHGLHAMLFKVSN